MLAHVYKLAKPHLSQWFLFLIFGNNILLTIIESALKVKISDSRYDLIGYLIVVKTCGSIVENFWIRPMIYNLARRVVDDFNTEAINKYDSMSFESKTTKPANLFWDKKADAQRAINQVVDWGFIHVMGLIGTFCGVVWTFYQKNILTELFIMLLLCIVAYIVVVKRKQQLYSIIDKAAKNISQSIQTKIRLNLIPFQYKEYLAVDLVDNCNALGRSQDESMLSWINIIGLTNTGNNIIAAVVSYYVSTNVQSFMLIYMTTSHLGNAIMSSTYFFTNYIRMVNDYDSMQDFWSRAEFKTEPVKLSPTSNLAITKLHVKKSTFELKMAANCGSIRLDMGEKIYIGGKSGSGKSTMIKAMFGLIPGATTNIGLAENYYHAVTDYFQEIKEKMPSSKITLRDYFNNETDNLIIDKYMRQVFGTDELSKIKASLLSQLIEFSDKSTMYDIELNEKISGGQKSRLILATRSYNADKNNKSIIVLDEPCPDVDHDTYTSVLNTFFANHMDKIIIMIGHLCECRKSSLNIKWTQEFNVDSGIIHRVGL